MELHLLSQFAKGWFVGNLHPTLIETNDVAVEVKHYRADDAEPRHHHRIATEITAVLSGVVRMSGQEIAEGARILVKPVGREGDGMHGLGISDDVNLLARKRGLPAVMP